jgi:hypothetical protein
MIGFSYFCTVCSVIRKDHFGLGIDSGMDHFETIIRAGGELWNFRYYLAVNGAEII